jgi:hypothetical protein
MRVTRIVRVPIGDLLSLRISRRILMTMMAWTAILTLKLQYKPQAALNGSRSFEYQDLNVLISRK